MDEADLMLDMGMLKDVRKIIKFIPEVRQTMFFSATMPTEIGELANSILNDPIRIDITPESPTVEIIQQSVYYVDRVNKVNLLVHILKDKEIESVIVLSRTKHRGNKIVCSLEKAGLKAESKKRKKSKNQIFCGYKRKKLASVA